MKRYVFALAMFAIVASLLISPALAQGRMRWQGCQGWSRGSAYCRMYDPKTVETLTGEVVSIERMTPMKGMGYGIHLTLKNAKETISVHLGPGWFIENQDTKLEAKTRIEVKGSRVTFDGKPAIIAAEVKKDDEVLKLRDENGIPMWVGWHRRGNPLPSQRMEPTTADK
jgi:hypothetical protein